MMTKLVASLANVGLSCLLLLSSWVTAFSVTEHPSPGNGDARQTMSIDGGAQDTDLVRTVECQADDSTPKRLTFTTTLGEIEVELLEDAAPDIVARLVSMAAGRDTQGGYYDGLSFDFTKPRTEIRTAEGTLKIDDFVTQIDARALELDKRGPRDAGEAMSIIQRELLVALRKNKSGDALTPQLKEWLSAWYENYDAEFLVGVSRKEINEALGFNYVDGLASRPVTRGSVALVPRDAQASSPKLSIALRDLPQRTGKWMVIGEVVRGLEVVDRISVAPLQQARSVKPTSYAPRNPVAIVSVVRTCAQRQDQSIIESS